MVLDGDRNLVGMVGEHMVRAGLDAVIDLHPLLGVQLVHQLAHGGLGNQLDEDPRGGVLGMAGVLTYLTDGLRTLPVRRAAYVLEIRPKRSEKYLFQGRIWVDAEDYALARAEGKPAKKPSFWTKSIHFVQIYQRCGPFWFPLSTQSVTEAHVFGTTDLSIEYFDYAAEVLLKP